MRTTSVLVIDNHAIVVAGCDHVISTAPDLHLVAGVDNSQDALTMYAQHRPDVVVIEPALEGVGGLEVARRLLARDESVRVLVFTAYESEVSMRRALELGALGYLSKRSAPEEFISALRCVARGEVYIDRSMTVHLVKPKLSKDGERITGLSAREFEVFRMVAVGHSVIGIAELLNVSPKTVSHHFTRAKKKLGVTNLAELTRLAIRTGLMTP